MRRVAVLPAVRGLALILVGVLGLGVAGCAGRTGDRDAGPATSAIGAAPAGSAAPAASVPTSAVATPQPGPTTDFSPAPVAAPPTDSSLPRPTTTGEQILAIGDSILVATEPNLDDLLPGITIDAVVGRTVGEGLAELRGYADQGLLRDVIVVELGTNSAFTDDQFDEFLDLAGGRPLVLVTNHCDRCTWTEGNNALIHARCVAAQRCAVADWEDLAQQHPDWFADDGIHIEIGGQAAQRLAELIGAGLP